MGNTSVEPVTVKESDFLSNTNTAEKDALYQDLFRKNADGEIVTGKKPKKSWLELFTQIMTFVTGIVIFLTFASGVHVFIKGQEDTRITEHLWFLCGYINHDINTRDDKGCKTASMLETEYREKQKQLENNIVNQLAVYIPLKVSSNILSASKETAFINTTYTNKVNILDIVKQFEDIRKSSEVLVNNIECGSFSITNMTTFSSQCTIKGGEIGATGGWRNKSLASSRIEATLFLEKLANTNMSHFILQNPPTTLSTELIKENEDEPKMFKTKTIVPLSLKYLSIPQQF